MINKAILNRRSIRSFSEEQVDDEAIMEIIKAAQFAPTAMNKRAWEFLVIKDEAGKGKLFELIGTTIKQEVIRTAPVILIPLMDSQKSVLPIQDLSLAIENIFIQITELGLGSFWKNVLPAEAEEIKKAFGIPERFLLLNIMPIGYPAQEPLPHSEGEFLESKIHFGQW